MQDTREGTLRMRHIFNFYLYVWFIIPIAGPTEHEVEGLLKTSFIFSDVLAGHPNL
jgi:hypothetical protein